ncbi:hypothetical protein PLICRDRAFT_178450 [Plicaturopsis crispa FD-325 SS-3]|nr:hypothetical protein PLICRDRAFT_178450 [Plicaturopsis crispa FD-325 SS-3]
MSNTTKPAPLTLYTVGTPNGQRVSVYLEELKAAYELDYTWKKMNFATKEQKEPWFLALSPNGRIPALVDHTRSDVAVFESAAILLYLSQHYDPARAFSWAPDTDGEEWSEMLQWMFFAHGGVAPMEAQVVHFLHQAPEKIPYAIARFVDETKRLFGVLELRLSGGLLEGDKPREWLVGDKYSIADMNAAPWVRAHRFVGVDSLDEWPHVKAWIERFEARGLRCRLGLTLRRYDER